MRFLYDAQAELRGFTLGGETYLYAKNLQGDVIAIVNEEGNVEVRYQYGPYGQMDANDAVTGNQELAELNPFTYRGYQYDQETGLYCLQSRYYNPEWKRFLNADSVELVVSFSDQIRAMNLYSYCYNDPIQNEDPSGYGITKPKKHPFSQKNRYSANKSLTNQINKYDKSKLSSYINGQGRVPYAYYQMGAFYADYNGCGWISVYNALVKIGKKKSPHDVINSLESISTSKYIGSVFGIGPLAITKYLKSQKINYSSWGPLEPKFYWSFDGPKTYLTVPNVENNVKKSKISIILFSTGKGMHYVATYWDKKQKKYIVYNRYNNSTSYSSITSLSSMQAGASKFIFTHIAIK